MDITRRTDYAIRILLELARRDGECPISVRALSESQGVPYAFARGIQRQLVEAGLVESVRGTKGGICLARTASSISLLDVIEAIQGPVSCSVCTSDPSWCSRMGGCGVHRVWKGADELLKEYLGRQVVSDLAAIDESGVTEWTS